MTNDIRAQRGGSILIMVMGVLAMMAVIVSTFVTVSRMHGAASVNRAYAVRMELLADGVLANVPTLMAQDLDQTQEPFDHPRFDPWLASVLTDNSGLGTVYRYITRLDLPDNEWARDPANGGRPPDNLDIAGGPTSGIFSDSGRRGIPDFPYYVDADGDGKADALLLPIGGGVSYPDGTCAYAAVRVVDNAHLNSRQHSKWPPYRAQMFEPWPSVSYNARYAGSYWSQKPEGTCIDDITDGRVDWTYLPDSDHPGRYVPRPRLPHVSLVNLRNMAGIWFGDQVDPNSPQFPDNPDGTVERWWVTPANVGPGVAYVQNPDAQTAAVYTDPNRVQRHWAAGNGWSWDVACDPWTHTDELYYPYEPGVNLAPYSFAPRSGTGIWAIPATNPSIDRPDMFPPPFTLEDDMALRMWVTDPSLNRYAHLWKLPFGTPMANKKPVPFQKNFSRCISSVTRERTKKWFAADENGKPAYATPFDLRKLLTGNNSDFDAAGMPSVLLLAKLNHLFSWMKSNNILGGPGIGYDGAFRMSADDRRAQYLANLVEYIRKPPTPTYIPGAYQIGGMTKYGFCRQAFLTEMLRDGGFNARLAGGLNPPAVRDFSTVQVGVEIYNPFDTPLDMSVYRLEFQSVGGPGPVVSLGSSVTVDLSPLGQLAPRGFAWVATDAGATVPGTNGTISARMGLLAGDAAAVRRVGPRMVVNLRCRAGDGRFIMMDTIDTRNRAGAGPYRAGDVTNLGILVDAAHTPSTPSGIDWSDWDGSGLTGQALADFTAVANNNWANNLPRGLRWQARRSGIYRPQGPLRTYWPMADSHSLSSATTGLWRGYWTEASSTATLDVSPLKDSLCEGMALWPSPSPGARNAAPPPVYIGMPPVTACKHYPQSFGDTAVRPENSAGNHIFGTVLFLPNRGVDPLWGARFVNLGELAHVLTVGNSVDNTLTQSIAAASEYARTLPISADPTVPPYTRPVTSPAYAGFPSLASGWPLNQWMFINFERQIKFDIYEGAAVGADGLPHCDNAKMLDIVSLYLGNGGPAAALNDFAPYRSDADDDTSLDYRAEDDRWFRPRYREGRINMNTAPWLVHRCLPWPREGRNDVCIESNADRPDLWFEWYSDACTAGLNVAFGECLAGTDAAVGLGYLNTPLPNGKDPYFRDVSDVFLFAQGANPNIANKYWNKAGVGWDANMYNFFGIVSGSAFWQGGAGMPLVHYDVKRNPHCQAYQYPLNKQLLPGRDGDGPMEYLDRGTTADLAQRDSLWAPMSNVVSTRSDVFTVYVLIKLLRPTPGVIQPTTGQAFEDLGQFRVVAIVDRTNCKVDQASGRADLSVLPRILARQDAD